MQLTPEQESRFWVKVDKTNACWYWTGAKNNRGYGNVRIASKYLLAHRVSYAIAYGIPDDMNVLHKCDNPACVRPNHLFLGTHQDNMDDMVAKGRAKAGPIPRANAAKTHCKRDHPLSGDNLYVTPKGERQCRICRKEADNRYKNKRTALDEGLTE